MKQQAKAKAKAIDRKKHAYQQFTRYCLPGAFVIMAMAFCLFSA